MTDINRTDANARSVTELLKEKKYQIDYYQREFRWQTKHVEELITDLVDKFLSNYSENHERTEGENYAHYFLGPIILSKKNGQTFIVDGQQRLTTLTLLLIYLNHLQTDLAIEKPVKLEDHIFATVRGVKSFNLEVPERESVIDAIYNGRGFDHTDKAESVQNIMRRYLDIEELFPDELKNEHALLLFIDWLLYNVDLVEIIAYTDEDAYTIFETMNDRGLNLNPTDMLKGFLLSNIREDSQKEKINQLWKKRILQLVELGRDLDVKNEEIEACKAWLRAKHANSIRERKRGSSNQDFEQIGTAFHRWVRDHTEILGLEKSEHFSAFVEDNFDKYTRYYRFMRMKSNQYDPEFEHIYFNAHNNFTLQYILSLAPIVLDDDDQTAKQKIQLVTKFIDIFVVRRVVNYRTLSYSSIVYSMFTLMKKLRDLDLDALQSVLLDELEGMEETLDAILDFRLHGQNKRHVQYLLARLTHHIERETGQDTSFPAYINRSGQKRAKRFEVEHIWADRFDRHTDEFDHEEAFRQYRNRFGGLLLLQRGFNQSYGDKPYEEKLPHYFGQNLLAQSLNPKCYRNNPNFLNYVELTKLPFSAHEEFVRKDLDKRQDIYMQIAKRIWDANVLKVILK